MTVDEGLNAKVRAIRELGATGALIVIILASLYVMLLEIRPTLALVPVIQRDLAQHRFQEVENARLARLSCRALAKLAELEGAACDPMLEPRL